MWINKISVRNFLCKYKYVNIYWDFYCLICYIFEYSLKIFFYCVIKLLNMYRKLFL